MPFDDKTYDILMNIAQIVLPALGSLYAGLAALWGFPYADQVVGTIVVIDTFLGAILKKSSIDYNNSKNE